jgi:exonuclease SbcC
MIPVRVKMSGFLSYKDEQEIPFSGSPLWMLAGMNGSGKSSVFDAVTYSLFGHHRGGSQNAAELINKESNALAVEFDFTLDGRLYRIKRTLKRSARGSASGTQQIFCHVGSSLSNESGWEAVPDTNRKTDFDNWIHEHVGLTYETFTSSVLLLQGKAEKLLDSKPSGRAEVLAGIVDLERYQRLHEKANARRLALKGQLESLTHQQAAIPEVSDLEYAAAVEAIELAGKRRSQTQKTIDTLQKLAEDARRWSDTQARLAASRDKLKQAESLLGESAKIEKAFARLQELKTVLSAVNTVIKERAKLQESERKTERLHKERIEAKTRHDEAEHNLEMAKKKRTNLQQTLADNEAKLAQVTVRLRELAAVLQSVKLAEDQEAELRRLDEELQRLPNDPATLVRQAEVEHDRLTELVRVLPILERLCTERGELVQALHRRNAAEQNFAKVEETGKKLRAEYEALIRQFEAAQHAQTQADAAVAGATVLAQQALESVATFTELAGEKNCRTCGQPLTPDHFEQEKRRREWDAKAAAKKHAEAIEAQRKAIAEMEQLRKQEEAARARLDQLREEYSQQKNEAKFADAEIQRHFKYLKLAYAELPEPYRRRVSPTPPDDWTRTSYPERDELIRLRDEATGLAAAKRILREAADTLDKWKQLTANIDTTRQTLTRLRQGLPANNLVAVREEFRTLQAAEQTLTNDIKGTKYSIAAADSEIDRFGRELHDANTAITKLVGKLQMEETIRANCRETIERHMSGLPPEWQFQVEKAGLGNYSAWQDEFDALITDDTESRYKQLEQARGGLETLRANVTALEQEAEQFPQDARRSPESVKTLLDEARKEYDSADAALATTRQRKAILDGYRDHRATLSEQYKQVDAEHNRYKILSELLGKDRLQRHLVRQAERQIVDYANAVLDRLSGGQLFLKLTGTDDGTPADKALDLECYNRVTGGSPINVAFLSGSQKFRVAVSLALGIGQYASKQHRPIQSVIIDEGFGCLDRNGRQVMIQELQNLRGHLHCILLVSHQEEFADAFPDGYRFELQNGATRVIRFQR